jgi:hypothetical protein
VAATSSRVFACATEGGLVAWDVDDPAAPSLVRTPDGVACRAMGLDADAERLAVAGDDGVQLWASDDTAAPLAQVDAPAAEVFDALLHDGQLFVAAGREGVVAYSTAGDALVETGRYADEFSDSRAIVGIGDDLVVADGASGVLRLDATSLTPRGSTAVAGPALDVAIDARGFAVVATLAGVEVVELRADALVSLGRVATPGEAAALVATGATVAVADWDRLATIDSADVTAPRLARSERLVGDELARTRAIATSPDGTLVVGKWDGVDLYEPACTTAAPAVSTEPAMLAYGGIADPTPRVLTIRNWGNRDLHVTEIRSTHPGIIPEAGAFTVRPAEGKAIEVLADPGDGSPIDTTLTLVTDDPDEPELSVRVTVHVPGVRVGEPVVPFRNLRLDGRVADSARYAGQVVLLAYFATW